MPFLTRSGIQPQAASRRKKLHQFLHLNQRGTSALRFFLSLHFVPAQEPEHIKKGTAGKAVPETTVKLLKRS
ncbi:hypothetical protein [Deinococcus cellulosilyticus]|uniref:hypothetical protein n=1 Tax=Deinococcus cellulosilyticus TaxID=401558 RepID=UPI0011BE01C9|nr:hypothetical protein [Deinococcus cellulosilyticus]